MPFDTVGSGARDALTGLYTADGFDSVLKIELARATRYRRPFGLLVLELNQPRSTHYELFPQVAPLMMEGLRRSDAGGRWRGTALALLLTETREAGGRQVAERIRTRVAATAFRLEEADGQGVKVSVGLAFFPVHGTTLRELRASADQAVRLARDEGGDRVVVCPDAKHPDLPAKA